MSNQPRTVLEPAAAGAAPPIEKAAAVAQFFVPAAASLQERRPRTLKHGDTFAVFDHNGDVLSGPGSPEGLYHADTRYLSHLYLTMNGARPMLLSSSLRDDNAALICDLSNPDLYDLEGQFRLRHDLIHIRRLRLLWNGACFERLAVRSFHSEHLRVRLSLTFAADYADIFEVRGAARLRRGELHPPQVGAESVTLAYTGLDSRRRATTLSFTPAPTALSAEAAEFELELSAGEMKIIFIRICCDETVSELEPRRGFFSALRGARKELKASSSRAAAVSTSNHTFNDAVCRNVADIYMLITETPQGPYPYAGIPWFSTAFGRDALITALEALWLDPDIARGVLGYLAANQAADVDDAADAEPGKILHEVRRGEMAELGEVPFRRYYGSIDSTPLFVMLAGAYLERSNDLGMVRALWPNVERALAWIDEYGDRDGDGFVEYGRRTDQGLRNQGWKDSGDSISHADGALAKGPIALAEVQAYVYGAWCAASLIARRLGLAERAQALADRAAALRVNFDRSFFDAELNTYVLALDGDKRPCRVRSSNAGHALYTGLALPERAAAVVGTLMSAESYSGWGIRTLAIGEVRYNPMSYHNGSVWPHDNAMIAAGFARYGFRREAARILEGLFDASTYMDLRRLPELFCGFPRLRAMGPTFYPVACTPQAWAAAAPMALLQACLGLRLDARESVICFEHPALPDFLDEVVLQRLRVGEAEADVLLRRANGQAVVSVLRREGDCEIITQL